MKHSLLFVFIFSFTDIFCQAYFINPPSPISFEITDGEHNTLPLEFRIFDLQKESQFKTFELAVNVDLSLADTNANVEESDFQYIRIRNSLINLDDIPVNNFNSYDNKRDSYYQEKRVRFYLDLDADFPTPKVEKKFRLLISINGEPTKWQTVVVTPKRLLTYSEDDYNSNSNIKLDRVFYAEPDHGNFILHGERNNRSAKVIVIPEKAGRFGVSQVFSVVNSPVSELVSIMTNPIKFRREVVVTSDELGNIVFPSTITTGFRNLGINLNIAEIRYDVYDYRGRKNSQSLGFGVMWLLGFERIHRSEFLPEISDPKTKDVFAPSIGLTISYKMNGFSLIAIPIGVDLISSSSNEGWVHLNRPWFGFGIGFNPNFFR